MTVKPEPYPVGHALLLAAFDHAVSCGDMAGAKLLADELERSASDPDQRVLAAWKAGHAAGVAEERGRWEERLERLKRHLILSEEAAAGVGMERRARLVDALAGMRNAIAILVFKDAGAELQAEPESYIDPTDNIPKRGRP